MKNYQNKTRCALWELRLVLAWGRGTRIDAYEIEISNMLRRNVGVHSISLRAKDVSNHC